MDLEKAVATQLANIEKRTGKSIAELTAIVKESGLTKHGELVSMLKTTLGMGHGDANMIVHTAKKADAVDTPTSAGDDVLDGLYVGPKAALRPVHEKLLSTLKEFGEFETAPKKGYVSYRRKKQFAMIGPATNTQVEIGINIKGLNPTDRLKELPPGQMCNYKIRIGGTDEVDQELVEWVRAAYDSAG